MVGGCVQMCRGNNKQRSQNDVTSCLFESCAPNTHIDTHKDHNNADRYKSIHPRTQQPHRWLAQHGLQRSRPWLHTHITTNHHAPPPTHTHACVCSKVTAPTHASTPRKHDALGWGGPPRPTTCAVRHAPMLTWRSCHHAAQNTPAWLSSTVAPGRMLTYDAKVTSDSAEC